MSSTQEALEIYESLEADLADEGTGEVSKKRRQAAYERIVALPDDGTAAYAFARAAVAGRVAQARGLSAIEQVKEAERFARKSVERDADYRAGGAQRLLGTLYVMAGKHTEHGDSEKGLELLEGLVERYPDDATNHVRLAEGYVNLGDPEGAFDPLCQALERKAELPGEERRLLDELVAEVGGPEVLACGG